MVVSNPVAPPPQYPHLNPSLLSTNRLLPRILTNMGHSPCASSSTSSCSSSPATTHTSTDSWGLNPQTIACHPDPPLTRRKKASRACGHCQKAHLTCDDGRPCLRCIKRGLTKTCADGVRKKAKYLSDYDDALLVRPRPAVKRTSEEILPTEDRKKVKTSSSDQDSGSIPWAELDSNDKFGISQYSNFDTQGFVKKSLGDNALNHAVSLGGLEEWLAGFESSPSTRNDPAPRDLTNLEKNVNQPIKTNQTRQRMQKWVERVERLVEIRKLTMNITADDEWMLKRNLDRSLMELDRIMSLSGTPTMIWSTSGEILKVGDEFCMLTEWRREELIGRHIEDIFEPPSLKEYLDLVEASVFPDHNFNCDQSADPSQSVKGSSQTLQQSSSSTATSSPSLPASPSLNSTQVVSQSHASNPNLDSLQAVHDSASANISALKNNKKIELAQTIKLFAVRKACGQESLGCSFCFRVGQDFFGCPSTIIANFLPILTRTSYSTSTTS